MNPGKTRCVKAAFVLLLIFAAAFIAGAILADRDASAAEFTAGKSGTAYNYDIGKGSDGRYYTYLPGSVKFAANDIKTGGKVYTGYCVNFYDETWFGWSYKAGKKGASVKLSANGKKWLPYVLLYGYHKGKASPVKGTNSNDFRAATEVMVWDFNEGWRTSASGGLKSDRAYKSIKGRPAAKIYKKMLEQIRSHINGPSFGAKKKASAKEYLMKYNYKTKKYSVSVKDTRKANYYKAVSSGGLKIKRSGYTYRAETGKAGTSLATWKNDIRPGTDQPLLIWQAKSHTAARQGVATGATDDTVFYTRFRTEKAGKLKLIKKSENGTVKGFRITVKAASGNSNGYEKTFTTDADGVITASIAPGKYKLTETLTAAQKKAGWKIKGTNPQTVTVRSDKTTSVTFRNYKEPEKIKSGVKIVKTTNNDLTDLSGFTFRVYGCNGAEDLTAVKALKKASAVSATGEDIKVEQEDIDEINKAVMEGKTGDYEIRLSYESTPAAAEKNSEEGQEDEETGNGSGDEGSGGEAGAVTYERTVTCHLKKSGAKETEYDAGTKENITASDFDHAGSAIIVDEKFVTDKEGLIAEDLEQGTYQVSEIMNSQQAARYRAPASQQFTLTEKDPKAEIEVENVEKVIDLKIVKTSDDGEVAGVEFTLQGKTSWGQEIEPVILTTDENGEALYEGLPAGEYTVTEKTDEEVYVPQEPQSFTADEDDVTLSFHNRIESPVEFSKESAVTGKELPGASIQIIDPETGEAVREWTSSDEPHIIRGLEYGKKYILHEDLAPLGYQKASDIEFTVGSDEKVTMIDEVTGITFLKKDAETGELLEGAVIKITDPESGKEVLRFTTDKKEGFRIEMLEDGKTYKACEVKAPEGYEKADDVSFTVGKDDTIVMKDRKKEKALASVPATGDGSGKAVAAAVIALVLSLSGFYALYSGSRRKNP